MANKLSKDWYILPMFKTKMLHKKNKEKEKIN